MIPDHVALPVEEIVKLLIKDKYKAINQWCQYGTHRIEDGVCVRCHVLADYVR